MIKDAHDKTIMVVDDDENILEAIKTILEMDNYQVVTDDGTKIDEKINQYRPSIILLDILLSGVDGRQICKRIKSKSVTMDTAVILISAHADAAHTYKSYCADDFLAKPFELEDLLIKIHKLS